MSRRLGDSKRCAETKPVPAVLPEVHFIQCRPPEGPAKNRMLLKGVAQDPAHRAARVTSGRRMADTGANPHYTGISSRPA